MEHQFDILLGDASSMKGDTSTHMNGVGGKMGKIFVLCTNVVDGLLGSLAESSIDVCRENESDGTIDKAAGGENCQGVILS